MAANIQQDFMVFLLIKIVANVNTYCLTSHNDDDLKCE